MPNATGNKDVIQSRQSVCTQAGCGQRSTLPDTWRRWTNHLAAGALCWTIQTGFNCKTPCYVLKRHWNSNEFSLSMWIISLTSSDTQAAYLFVLTLLVTLWACLQCITSHMSTGIHITFDPPCAIPTFPENVNRLWMAVTTSQKSACPELLK